MAASHFVLKRFPELRLGRAMLTVLVFEIADLFVHLPQLILKLLDVRLALLRGIVHRHELLICLNEHLLLVLSLQPAEVYLVLVLADFVLQGAIGLILLDEAHSHLVKS